MKIEITEDPNLPKAASIFQETIIHLTSELDTATTDEERNEILQRIKRIRKELQALNRIRRLFLRRKRRGDPIC